MSIARMRAKMRVISVQPMGSADRLTLACVAKDGPYPSDGSDEDNSFAKFSPSGRLALDVANPSLMGQFEVGDTYYVDFSLIPKPGKPIPDAA